MKDTLIILVITGIEASPEITFVLRGRKLGLS